jgi:thiol-disulfide isomerase/thioredoxin
MRSTRDDVRVSASGRSRRRERARSGSTGPRPARRSVWRGPLPIAATVVVVLGAVAYFVLSARAPAAPSPSPASNAAVIGRVTSIPAPVFDAVGGGNSGDIIKAAPAGEVLRGPSGKPLVVYVGAEYCPFCASERWSFIIALSRFGTWNGLATTMSSSKDVFPNTPTFTFRGATYTSDALELSAVEVQDREGRTIASLTPVQNASYTRLDRDLSIPFLSIADRYYSVGSGYPPDLLAGKSWDEIATALRDPSSSIAKAIVGHADKLTAAICAVTQQQPAGVCSSDSVKGLTPPSQ